MPVLESELTWTGDPDYARSVLDYKEQLLPKWCQRATGSNGMFAALAGLHFEVSSFLWVLDDKAQAVQRYRMGAWHTRWWYRLLHMDADAHVELPLLGTDQTIVMCGRAAPSDSQAWTSDLVHAQMVDDQGLREMLIGTHDFVAATDAPLYGNVRLELWRALFGESPDLGDRLEQARAELDAAAEVGTLPNGDSWKDRHRAELGLIGAVVQRSQDVFDHAITAAHQQHVRYYSGTTRDGNPQNALPAVMLNRPFSVLVSHGVRSGLELNYTSPYFVDWSPWLDGLDPIAPECEPG